MSMLSSPFKSAVVKGPDIARLRQDIARLEHSERTAQTIAMLSTGSCAIDRQLPGGGLQRGALHEIASEGPAMQNAGAAAFFAASLLARLPGQILWILTTPDLFPPALCETGLSPDRVLLVEAGPLALLAMEEALRATGLVGVVADVQGALTLTASRRLQLAAEASGVTGIILRHSQRPGDPQLKQPIAALTRWRIASLPVGLDAPYRLRARWRLDLVRCRGGEAGSWVVEVSDAQDRLDLVAELADRPDTADIAGKCATGPADRAAGA